MARASRRILLQAYLAVSLALVACSASPSSSPSSVSSPSGSPVDIVQHFTDAMLDPALAGRAVISGSVTALGQDGDVSGSVEFAGSDSHMALTIVFAGVVTASEMISRNGNQYTRTADGPWVARSGATSSATLQSQVTDVLADLRDDGVEQVGGESLHHLVLANAPNLDADFFGLRDPSIVDVVGGADFYARADGTPAVLQFTLSWNQAGNAAEMEMRLALDLSAVPEIRRPDEVWATFDSDRNGYSIAYPERWVPEKATGTQEFDLFYTLSNTPGLQGEVQVRHYTGIPADVTAADWFADSSSAMSEGFAAEVEASEPLTVDSLESRYFALHYDQEGRRVFHQEAIVFAGGQAWEIYWFSGSGHEEVARAIFDDFIATFDRAASAEPAGGPEVPLASLAVGDCFDTAADYDLLGYIWFGSADSKSQVLWPGSRNAVERNCADPHSYEVLAVFPASQTEIDCTAPFPAYVGVSWDSSELNIVDMSPSDEERAAGIGDVCAIFVPTDSTFAISAEPTSGSLKGSGR